MNFDPTDIMTATAIRDQHGQWHKIVPGSPRYALVDLNNMLPPGTTPPQPFPAPFWVLEVDVPIAGGARTMALQAEDVRGLRF